MIGRGHRVRAALTRGVGAALVVLAAGGAAATAEPGLFGDWRAEAIGGRPVADDVRLTLSLSPDGAVSGSGGCNRFSGTAVVDGNDVTFPPFAASEKMCASAVMIPEQEFLGALAAVATYRLRPPNLLLYDAEGRPRLKMTRPKE